MADILSSISHNAKFSTEEIMPLLEQKISSIMNEEYVIDFFITNGIESSEVLEVSYYAFPKEISNSYLKMAFIHNNFLYTYIKEDSKHEYYKKDLAHRYVIQDTNFKNILLGQLKDHILIAKEIISVNDVFGYLTLPHKEKYHLFDNFFQYDENWDEILNKTIENFAKQKVHTL